MTKTVINLPSAIANRDDANFLRELLQDAAHWLMDIGGGLAAGWAVGAPTGRHRVYQ